jgi:hypothetical protein
MSHPHSTCARLDAVDDLDASSSIGPNSSLEVLIPLYSDLLTNFPFLQLAINSIHDNDESDPSFHPMHK